MRILTLTLLLAGFPPYLEAQQARYRDVLFPDVDMRLDVAYGSAISPITNQPETLRMDIFSPRGDTATERPMLVLVHGGGFVSGNKNNLGLRSMAAAACKRGYVACSINYRLLSTRPQSLSDILISVADFKAAVRFVRRNVTQLGVDPDRIACLGSSAGAFICLEAAYGNSGPGTSGNPGFRDDVQVVVDLWGGLVDDSVIEKTEAPLMIVHGTADPVVPFAQAQELEMQARTVDLPHEYYPLQGLGHGPWNAFDPGLHDDVFGFFYEHLRLDQVSGLAARPGYASPGTLILDGFGVRDESALLFVSTGKVAFPFLDLGVWCLDGSALVELPVSPFGNATRQPLRSTILPVPPGFSGLTLHWQEIRVSARTGALRTVTNCVTTTL